MANDTESKSIAIIPRTTDEARSLAKSFASSTLMPDAMKGKEADVFVQIIAGLELGLAPMASIRGVHVVQGKPILSADTMVGLVLGSGLAEYFSCVSEDLNQATYETKRRGAPAQRCTFSMDDANRAGITSNPTWKKYPRAMLKARAKAMLARDVFPDVLAGCYDETERDEIERSAPTRTNGIHAPTPAQTNVDDAEFTETKVDAGPSLADQCTAAETFDALRALVPQINKLAKGSDERVRTMDAYKAATKRMEESAKSDEAVA